MRLDNYSCKYYGGNKILSSYLNDIRKYKVLEPEEETALFEQAANGDENAINKIVLSNQRFVYALAKIYSKDENEVIDFVNEGNIGMMEAIKRFDATRGMRFITFAVWYIRRSMNYYLCVGNKMINRSNAMKYGKKISRIKQKYYAENGMLPSNEDIVVILKDEYNLSVKDMSDIYEVNISSISDEIDDDFTVDETSDFNEATASVNTFETEADNEYTSKIVDKLLDKVPDNIRNVIKMLYGIGYERAYTVEEIAEEMDLEISTVNKLKRDAIKYLRQFNNDIYGVAI